MKKLLVLLFFYLIIKSGSAFASFSTENCEDMFQGEIMEITEIKENNMNKVESLVRVVKNFGPNKEIFRKIKILKDIGLDFEKGKNILLSMSKNGVCNISNL